MYIIRILSLYYPYIIRILSNSMYVSYRIVSQNGWLPVYSSFTVKGYPPLCPIWVFYHNRKIRWVLLKSRFLFHHVYIQFCLTEYIILYLYYDILEKTQGGFFNQHFVVPYSIKYSRGFVSNYLLQFILVQDDFFF